MLHLSSERLAALADSEPTPLEADHLAACVACARERAATRSLLMMARAEREQLGMPLTRWDSLAPELHRAGLVAAGALMSAPPVVPEVDRTVRARTRRAVRWLQAAAVIFVAVGSAALGRLSAGASLLPSQLFVDASPPSPVDPLPPLPPLAEVNVAAMVDGPPEFSSVDEARSALRRYEAFYQQAAAYLADHDTTARVDLPEAYRARLAALDRVGRAMSEALREAPYDPVINGYYLTTRVQREATKRQLGDVRGHPILSF